jgi:hypothetical protein
MHPRRLITVGLGVLALLAPAAPASAKAKDPGYVLTKDRGVVVRWNPCVPIRYKVNVAHAPKGALADVKQAIALLHKATGMTFVYEGQTAVIPQFGYGIKAPAGKWPPIIIAWAAPGKGKGKSNAVLPGDAGRGGPLFTSWYDANGTLHPEQVVSGQVVMNDQYNGFYKHGFGRGYTDGEVLLHELGHVVGLQHTSDPTQIMYPAANFKTKAAYGKGDRVGLKKVGKAAGCINPKPLG